jgi:hypothetical protein
MLVVNANGPLRVCQFSSSKGTNSLQSVGLTNWLDAHNRESFRTIFSRDFVCELSAGRAERCAEQ